ncbi:hypothetical protein ACFLZN_00605 [Nanoarchaeota archaeon]
MAIQTIDAQTQFLSQLTLDNLGMNTTRFFIELKSDILELKSEKGSEFIINIDEVYEQIKILHDLKDMFDAGIDTSKQLIDLNEFNQNLQVFSQLLEKHRDKLPRKKENLDNLIVKIKLLRVLLQELVAI